jgi:Domain of unknown function (DUF4440)
MMSRIVAAVILLIPFATIARAQNGADADRQKLIAIEQALAVPTTMSSPEMSDAMQKYLYDGTVSSVNGFGRLFRTPKSEVMTDIKKPNAADPNAKSQTTVSDFQTDFYGDTALVSYKANSRDTGHKEAALNTETRFTCLDTFIKRSGQWNIVGNSCVPATPISKEAWDAVTRMRQQENH